MVFPVNYTIRDSFILAVLEPQDPCPKEAHLWAQTRLFGSSLSWTTASPAMETLQLPSGLGKRWGKKRWAFTYLHLEPLVFHFVLLSLTRPLHLAVKSTGSLSLPVVLRMLLYAPPTAPPLSWASANECQSLLTGKDSSFTGLPSTPACHLLCIFKVVGWWKL